MNKYNGWANWDTWAANLWLTSYDEVTYNRAVEISNFAPLAGNVGKILSLTNLLDNLGNPDEINYDNVSWDEVIGALTE